MNGDPSKVDVLYANVYEIDGSTRYIMFFRQLCMQTDRKMKCNRGFYYFWCMIFQVIYIINSILNKLSRIPPI